MAKLDEIDLLRLQNLSMRAAMAKRDVDEFAVFLNAKYNGGKPGLRIAEDGTILAEPTELRAVEGERPSNGDR